MRGADRSTSLIAVPLASARSCRAMPPSLRRGAATLGDGDSLTALASPNHHRCIAGRRATELQQVSLMGLPSGTGRRPRSAVTAQGSLFDTAVVGLKSAR